MLQASVKKNIVNSTVYNNECILGGCMSGGRATAKALALTSRYG